jgi:hypothetical protein
LEGFPRKKKVNEIFQNRQNYLWGISVAICEKIFRPIGQNLMMVTGGTMTGCQKPMFSVKNLEDGFKIFFLEHVTHQFGSSIYGKNVSSIGLAVFELWKTSKKRGYP